VEGYRRLTEHSVMRAGDLFVFKDGEKMIVADLDGHLVKKYSCKGKNKCFRKAVRRTPSVARLISEALWTDGAHHKDEYLRKIAKTLKIRISK
jgi:hypothetical protein